MKIVDRNKDYYDYLQGVYGINSQIVFDRQNSVLRENDCWDKIFNRKYVLRTDRYYNRYNHSDDNEEFFVLECGFTQYLFLLEIMKNNKWKLLLRRVFKDNKHYKNQPLTIYFVQLNIWGEYNFEKLNYANDVKTEYAYNKNHYGKKGDVYIPKHTDIELPVLKNLGIPAIIPAEEIWRDLYNYLLHIKLPEFVDNRTDIDKLQGKGFDKITSFRPPIK